MRPARLFDESLMASIVISMEWHKETVEEAATALALPQWGPKGWRTMVGWLRSDTKATGQPFFWQHKSSWQAAATRQRTRRLVCAYHGMTLHTMRLKVHRKADTYAFTGQVPAPML